MSTTAKMDVDTSAAIERFSERIARLDLSLRAEFRVGLAENRRHTPIRVESRRGDIRIVVDGFAAVSTEFASLQR